MRLISGDIDKQYFIFTLGKRYFGVSIREVVKVITVNKVFTIPFLEDYFLGFILHEGKPVPFMSLKNRIGLPGKENGTVALLVFVGTELLGLSIDTNYQVIQLVQEPLGLPSDFKGAIKRFFKARGILDNQTFIILNIPTLASTESFQ